VSDTHGFKYDSLRDLNEKEAAQLENIVSTINNLYNPVAYITEEPRTFDYNEYKDTLAVQNLEKVSHKMGRTKEVHFSNTMSQMYSRNKVRDLLDSTIKNKNIAYDFVIMIRFDYFNTIPINLYEIDTSVIIVSNYMRPRKLVGDNILILPVQAFLDIFNIYKNLDYIMNNEEINQKMMANGEYFFCSPEEMVTASIYYTNNIYKLEFHPLGEFLIKGFFRRA